jgi:predicted RNase H-like HicB family nuclease
MRQIWNDSFRKVRLVPAFQRGSPYSLTLEKYKSTEGLKMLTEYIKAAMRRAHYEILPDGEGFFGKIEGFQGVWAHSNTLENCREELQEVLEEWILIGLKQGTPIPIVDGIELDVKQEAA